MLVLSRKEGERIMIGRNIVITVVESSGNRVRLGVTAPRDIPVNRQEVFERIAHDETLDSLEGGRAESLLFTESN